MYRKIIICLTIHSRIIFFINMLKVNYIDITEFFLIPIFGLDQLNFILNWILKLSDNSSKLNEIKMRISNTYNIDSIWLKIMKFWYCILIKCTTLCIIFSNHMNTNLYTVLYLIWIIYYDKSFMNSYYS